MKYILRFGGGARVGRSWYCEKPCNYGCQSQSRQMTLEAKKNFPIVKKIEQWIENFEDEVKPCHFLTIDKQR